MPHVLSKDLLDKLSAAATGHGKPVADVGTSKWFLYDQQYGTDLEPIMMPIPPFNLVFEPDTGRELISVYVPDYRVELVKVFLLEGHSEAALKRWACFFIGREFDIPRCTGVAIRVVTMADGDRKIEMRMAFDPPWYYNQLVERANAGRATGGQDQGHASEGERATVPNLSSPVSMAGELSGIREQLPG